MRIERALRLIGGLNQDHMAAKRSKLGLVLHAMIPNPTGGIFVFEASLFSIRKPPLSNNCMI